MGGNLRLVWQVTVPHSVPFLDIDTALVYCSQIEGVTWKLEGDVHSKWGGLTNHIWNYV